MEEGTTEEMTGEVLATEEEETEEVTAVAEEEEIGECNSLFMRQVL